MKISRLLLSKSITTLTITVIFIIAITPAFTFSAKSNPDSTLADTSTLEPSKESHETKETLSENANETSRQTLEEANESIGEPISDNINILSGLNISEKVLNSRPIAIMVQNNPKARPHSGLIYADMVIEMVAEGGVTRFIALFSSYDADIIGPVRSARIYFAEIARGFDPIFTFWGSYPQAYEAIKNMDMDVLDANSMVYVNYTSAGWRDPTRSDALEHTAFIDTYGIKKDAKKYGYSLEGGQSPVAFKLDAPENKRGNINDITVNFSSESYVANFSYDVKTNKYLKYLAGQPHTDFETGQQISLNNIIVLITDIEGPIDQHGHMLVRSTGTHEQGQAYYFIDGNSLQNPLPVLTSIKTDKNGLLIYKVQKGDTLLSIASNFGISLDTIRWANNLKSDKLVPNQQLIILPVSGVLHEIQPGDTLETIAERYSATIEKIIVYNQLSNKPLIPGEKIIVPDGRIPRTFALTPYNSSLPSYPYYYILPTTGFNWGVLHNVNAVDIANHCGTPIVAAAEGLVEKVAFDNSYGKYIQIKHPNNTSTLYAHLNEVQTKEGDFVLQGQLIGLMGNTGYVIGSPGCHLHFEVHGAKNPFAK